MRVPIFSGIDAINIYGRALPNVFSSYCDFTPATESGSFNVCRSRLLRQRLVEILGDLVEET
ncbi:MAG: hypothetical protein Q8J92_10700, partial [Parvibaculum sp.]|nr:hypothetical protein [Parvibaculum sp.]